MANKGLQTEQFVCNLCFCNKTTKQGKLTEIKENFPYFRGSETMKYIQSFYQYPVTFSAIGKTVPARSAQGEMKNIAEVTEKELEKLENCEPFFRELVSKKKYRVLNHIPTSYIPPAKQINDAHDEADKLRKELEAAKAKIAELEGGKDAPAEDTKETEVDYSKFDYKDLQNMAKEKGIDPNQKKAVLVAELKKADEASKVDSASEE